MKKKNGKKVEKKKKNGTNKMDLNITYLEITLKSQLHVMEHVLGQF